MAINTTKQIDDELLRRIGNSGHSVWIDDSVIKSTDDVAVQAIVDSYTLDDAKKCVCAKVSALAKAKRDKVVESISAGEMASWPIKREEALKYSQTGNPADAPLLSAESVARGITLLEMMQKVSSNATYFAGMEAAIGGADGRHRDAIMALNDFSSVYTYDYLSGWPV